MPAQQHNTGPWLETRQPYDLGWQRFLPLNGLGFSRDELHLLLDGRIVTRQQIGRMECQYRLERWKEDGDATI